MACVAIAIAAHALALLPLQSAGPAPDRVPTVRMLWLNSPAAPPTATAPAAAPPAAVDTVALAPVPPARAPAPERPVAPLPATQAPSAPAAPHATVDTALLARYHPPAELTRRQHLLAPPDMDLKVHLVLPPPGSRMQLLLLVSAAGVIDQVIVESSSLPEPFRSMALARAAEARFAPGEIDGVAVPTQVRVELSY